ncbi:MAG: hypothetical protein AB7I35_11520 [Ramlibacter sp.]|nr:hypothetical protein [Ramlibacter sp.]
MTLANGRIHCKARGARLARAGALAGLVGLLGLAGCTAGGFSEAWLKANCERSQPCNMTCPDGSPAPHGGATCMRRPAL